MSFLTKLQSFTKDLTEVADIQHYIDMPLAASTKQTYSPGKKRFIDFSNYIVK